MRFGLEQRFSAPLEAVEDGLLDPGFLARLARLPELGAPEVLSHEVEGEVVRQRVRYRFTGDLAPAVTAVVDPDRLTWVEESTLDRRAHRTTWRILPDHYASLLRCSGTFQLEPAEGEHTVRVTQGEVKVHMPLVGSKAEKGIVSGLEEHAVLQARAVEDWLAGRRHP